VRGELYSLVQKLNLYYCKVCLPYLMQLKSIYITFLMFFLVQITFSQRYNFKAYGLKEGLPSLQIMDMDIDSSGNLWLATLAGGVKFNGHSFITEQNEDITESDNLMASVHVASNQTVWFGTWNGKVIKITPDTLQAFGNDKLLRGVMAISEGNDNNPILFTSTGVFTLKNDTLFDRIFSYNDKSFFPVKSEMAKTGFYVINKYSKCLHFGNNHQLKKVIDIPSLPKSIHINTKEDKLYLGSFGKIFEIQNDSIVKKYQLTGIDSTSYIYAINQDEYGNLWFGVGNHALYYWQKGTPFSKAVRIGKENGLPDGRITDIIIKDNRVWVATDGNGLYTFGGLGLSYLNFPGFLKERNIMAVKPYKSGVVFATDKRVYYYNEDTRVLSELKKIHPSLYINDIEVLGDSIFVVSNNDAYLYYKDNIQSLSAEGKAPFDVFYRIYKDSIEKALYFGGENTFNKLKKDEITSYKKKYNRLDVRSLVKINDTVFIKGGQHLWSFLEIISEDSIRFSPLLNSYKDKSNIIIHSLYKMPDGNVFAAGQSNLYYLRMNKSKVDTIFKYPLRKTFNLPTARALYYRKDTVYLLGPSSLLSFSYPEYLKTGTFNYNTLLTAQTGFWGGTIDESFYIDKNGKIYIGTSECLMIYNPKKQYSPQPSKPKIELTQVKLYNNPVKWTNYTDSVYHSIGYHPTFSYDENNLSFYFGSTSLSLMENIQYRYRLLGYDSIWSEPTTSPYISFASLPPGNYTIQAVAGLGNLWSHPYSYTFTINPPFWQTTWFYIATSFILLLSMYGFYYYRTQRLKMKIERQKLFAKSILDEQEKERKRIAKDLHDSIGQQLLLIKNQANDNRHLSDMVKNTIEEVRTISRNIHPVHLEKFGLLKTLEHVADTISSSSEIFVSTNLDFEDNKLTDMQQIAIYRMVQEIFNNILKHSKATGVKIEAFIENNYFILIIKDNGVGFNKNDKLKSAKSLGLNSLYERASLINGQLEIESMPRKGTTVTLKVQLQ